MGGKRAARPAIRTPGNFGRHVAVWAMFFPRSGGLVSIRPIKRVVQSQPTLEGAGVKLRRAFGFGNTGDFDPFLLLDDFRNEHPQDYLAGARCGSRLIKGRGRSRPYSRTRTPGGA